MKTCHSARLLLLGLECLLAVAPYHDNGEEAAHNGAEEDDQNNGYADGPNARRKEGLKGVVFVNEGLRRLALLKVNS
jgi:hypothetical protein